MKNGWVRESENWRGISTILGVNFFLGGGLKPWKNKAEKIAEKSPSKFPEKFAAYFPTFRQAKMKIHHQSALQSLGLKFSRVTNRGASFAESGRDFESQCFRVFKSQRFRDAKAQALRRLFDDPSQKLLSSASKCHFQSVIFHWGISRAPRTSLGTSPCTRAKVTLVHRSHTQQNKGKQVSFPEKTLGTPLEAIEFIFLCKGSTPETEQK